MSGEFPKLMWAPDDREFTVKDAAEQAEREAEGFRLTREPQDRVLQNESTVSDDHEPKKKAKK